MLRLQQVRVQWRTRGLHDDVPHAVAYERDITSAHAEHERGSVANLEHHALQRYVGRERLPRFLGIDQNVGHGDDHAEVLGNVHAQDAERFVGLDDSEAAQHRRADVVGVEAARRHLLGLCGAEHHVLQRQRFIQQKVGRESAPGC